MEFREKLIQLRDESKLSQQELADLLDVSRQTVSRWESGKSTPSAKQIANLCAVFHVDANGLMTTQAKEDAADEQASEEQPAKKLNIPLLAVLGTLLLIAVAGLIITIVYAVKDGMYDAGTTVLIMYLPQNTPMVVLCVFLGIFIILLALLLIYLLRGRKK